MSHYLDRLNHRSQPASCYRFINFTLCTNTDNNSQFTQLQPGFSFRKLLAFSGPGLLMSIGEFKQKNKDFKKIHKIFLNLRFTTAN
jgi:hypothetical protein